MTDQSIIEDAKASLLHEEEHLHSADMVDDFLKDPIVISVFTKFAQLREARQSSQSEPVAMRFRYADTPNTWHHNGLNDTVMSGYIDMQYLYAAPQQAILSEDLRIYIEHGFVCARTETGQLLASRKVDDFKPYEFLTLSASPTAPIESDK
jgi:hypothetical protein